MAALGKTTGPYFIEGASKNSENRQRSHRCKARNLSAPDVQKAILESSSIIRTHA
jgi:hypothetical protein